MPKKKHHSLYGQILQRLDTAFAKVKANRGAAGVDRESIVEFEANLEANLAQLKRDLKEKTYVPQPVRRVYIPKANGGQRPLGIPTVRDRVVQQALRLVLEPVFEPLFCDSSYGFRPGRSAHQALDRVSGHLREGYKWVVDCDLKAYFDTIPQEALIDRVAEEVADGTVLRLIRSFLRAGVMSEGQFQRTIAGTPQGGVISPLLANIYLHSFDQLMEDRGLRMTRYADDFVILCRSRRAAERVMGNVQRYLEGQLGLTVNREKSKVVHLSEGFVFLGYEFGTWGRRPGPKAILQFKQRIRELTRRNQTIPVDKMVREQLNPYLRGWAGYFGYGQVKQRFLGYDQWIRRRLRMVQLRSWRHVKGLHRALRQRGWQGPLPAVYVDLRRWKTSVHSLVNFALGQAWVREIGLVSLVDFHRPTLVPVTG